MRGAIPPLFHTSSWLAAYLKHGTLPDLTLTLDVYENVKRILRNA